MKTVLLRHRTEKGGSHAQERSSRMDKGGALEANDELAATAGAGGDNAETTTLLTKLEDTKSRLSKSPIC